MMGNVVSISGFEVPVANGIMFSLRIGGFLKDDSNEFIYSQADIGTHLPPSWAQRNIGNTVKLTPVISEKL